jgi:hypothetical protein
MMLAMTHRYQIIMNFEIGKNIGTVGKRNFYLSFIFSYVLDLFLIEFCRVMGVGFLGYFFIDE